MHAAEDKKLTVSCSSIANHLFGGKNATLLSNLYQVIGLFNLARTFAIRSCLETFHIFACIAKLRLLHEIFSTVSCKYHYDYGTNLKT